MTARPAAAVPAPSAFPAITPSRPSPGNPSGHPAPGSGQPSGRPAIALRIAAAAAIIGVCAGACGAQAASGRSSPPKLKLSGMPAAAPPGPAQAGATGGGVRQGSDPASAAGPAHVEVAGHLPATGPSRDAVRQLPGGPAAGSEVRALAAALHLTGSPQRAGTGWRVTGPGTLQVSGGPGLRWSYRGAPGQPCGGPLEGYAAPGRHGPAPIALTALTCPQPLRPAMGWSAAGGPPSPGTAESAAARVLEATGITGSPLRASVTGDVTSVSADPSVQGLPTAGFSTVVQVNPSGGVTAASGWLSHPAGGAAYPLVSAGQAAQALRAAARPASGGSAPVLQVTGASYGLALAYDGTGPAARPVLVPAWLLHVAGSAEPVPAVAVSPRYLAAR